MPQATISNQISGDVTGAYSTSFQVEGGGRVSLVEPIPDGSTDLEVALELDVSQVKCFALRSTQDIVVETNDGSSAANTFTLEANVPYIFPQISGQSWTDTEDGAVSTDITAIFVTNSSGSAATLNVDVIYDPTV